MQSGSFPSRAEADAQSVDLGAYSSFGMPTRGPQAPTPPALRGNPDADGRRHRRGSWVAACRLEGSRACEARDVVTVSELRFVMARPGAAAPQPLEH